MIKWPSEVALSEADRRSLARFRQTTAARELAGDRRTWQLEATSWVDEFPARLVWRSEERREVCFTLEETGIWMLTPVDARPVQPNPGDPLSTSGGGA